MRVLGSRVDAEEAGDGSRPVGRPEAVLRDRTLQAALLTSASVSSIATDVHGTIQIFGFGAERMLGYAAADVVTKITPAAFTDPEELASRASALSLEFATTIAPSFEALAYKASRGIDEVFELTCLRKDGARVRSAVSVAPLCDRHDAIIGYLLLSAEVASRQSIEDERRRVVRRMRDRNLDIRPLYIVRSKPPAEIARGPDAPARLGAVAEEEMRSSELRYRRLFEAARDGILILDRDTGKVNDVNPFLSTLLGYSREEMIGKTVGELSPAKDAGSNKIVLERLQRDGYIRYQDLPLETKDGRRIAVEFVSNVYQAGERKVIQCNVRDINSRSRAEALDAAIRQIDAMASALPDFPGFCAELRGIVAEFMPARNFYVALHDEATNLLSFPYFVDERELAPDPRPLDRGVTSYVLLTGRPLLSSQEDFEAMLQRGEVELEGSPSLDWLGVPLVDGPTTFGVLAVQCYSENRSYGEREKEILTSLSRHIGSAIATVLAQSALKNTADHFRLLFERNLAGVYRSSLDGRILECNEAFTKIFGFESPKQALSASTADLYLTPREREARSRDLRAHGMIAPCEQRLRRSSGQIVWTLLGETLVAAGRGQPATIEGTVLDITDRKCAEEKLEHQAYHDGLTGLPNRSLFQDRLTIAIEGARRRRNRLAVLFLDLDHFKLCNDSVGHGGGDAMLAEIARRLRAATRANDTVARVGGDEFLILLSEAGTEEGMALVATKLLDVIAEPMVIQGSEMSITTSIGIAVYPDDGEDVEKLVMRADSAMYRAKEAGRNTFRGSAPARENRPDRPLAVAAALRHALERDELRLHYQPIVACSGGEIVGAEALLRWHHPDHAAWGPARFIPVAEDHGLIGPIGEWVLMEACRRARQWHTSGHPAIRVAINLSVRQFQQPDLVATVERILETTGMAPELLNLEITESVAIRNTDRAISILRAFRDLGIRISIDDFGTGYSSLTYLRTLPIDFLKIDASFVRMVGLEAANSAIVKSVIDLAHALGIQVTAEGVETSAQHDLLCGFGCDEFQGHLFLKAVPVDEMDDLLARSRVPAGPPRQLPGVADPDAAR